MQAPRKSAFVVLAIPVLFLIVSLASWPGLMEFLMDNKTSAAAGIGFGTALAIAISWSANKSILWAMLHGALSWIYVIYYAVTR